MGLLPFPMQVAVAFGILLSPVVAEVEALARRGVAILIQVLEAARGDILLTECMISLLPHKHIQLQ